MTTGVPFADVPAAERALARLTAIGGGDRLGERLLSALAAAASPDRALVACVRLLDNSPDPRALLDRLAADARTLEVLLTIFAGSQFLGEILLRAPELLDVVLAVRDGPAQIKDAESYYAEARAAAPDFAPDALRRYQRAELLRIGAGDLLGLFDLATVTAQLSSLADGMMRACLEGAAAATGMALDGFAVLALGKLGGGELNYSSDVDLSFVVVAEGAERYERLARRLIAALSDVTDEGFLYRVDMRLRPWGGVGPLTPTVAGYLAYLRQHARLWERQALLRARPVAGDLAAGRAFLAAAEPLLFGAGPEAVRAEVFAMKQRTEAQLQRQGRAWGEVKLGAGSIRDVEFVAQYLQLAYGGAHPELRTANTVEALARLTERGFLPADEQRILAEGYVFFRTVEHSLQIMDYRQTHTLPHDPADLRYLARRLGYILESRFLTGYEAQRAAVRAVYLRHLADPSLSPTTPDRSDTMSVLENEVAEPQSSDGPQSAGSFSSSAASHLAHLPPAYAAAFSPAEIEAHAALAARLADDDLLEVDALALDAGHWRVTLVGYDYLGILSAICGLLFVHGFSIADGQVFTYEPGAGRRKIVDVFNVRSVRSADGAPDAEVWLAYRADLLRLAALLGERRVREAQGELAKLVAVALRALPEATSALTPVELELDNAAAERYTLLRIDAQDTPGFLYEFTNALALAGVHIARVEVQTVGHRVQDTFHVTDARGGKITSPVKARELRAAAVLVKQFTHLLPASPNPEAALLHFHEYLGELFARPSWPDELASIERPEVLHALARLLGVSEFLWDDFLRMQYANLFPVVRDVAALGQPKGRGQLADELARALAAAPHAAPDAAPAAAVQREVLNAFKDREMFRVDMRHILGHIAEFGQFSTELTDLVETVVTAAAALADAELRGQHGAPVDEDGRSIPLAVTVLGKSGGYELGFASDIEVMFVYGGPGVTRGPKPITAAEYFDKLVAEFARAIWARRGGIFEIDLELRPYGKAGSLAVSADAFRRYFAPGGPAWAYERQALIKLRAVAGDAALGRQVEALRDAYVYSGAAFDVAAMRAMRERQMRHLAAPGQINVKYSLGGLADVEYLVQGLQMTHGAAHPALRSTNTRAAIAALAQRGLISVENGVRLSEAHLFLQRLINALRVVRGNSKDLTVPPDESEDFAFLARRLGYGDASGRLRADLTEHMATVQRLGRWLLG